MDSGLTDRQRREQEFYEEYSAAHAELTTSFDPIEGRERRPWNSYWFVYQRVRELYNHNGQRLLDFGCGSGVASVRYARIGYEVHGFDISENNVTLCRERARKYELDGRTRFKTQTAERLEYPDAYFDIAAGIDILHHVDIPPAIREVHRVLKPGGVALFREWIEVPVFETVRNSALVRRFFPKGLSMEDHRTADERKLTAADVAAIKSVFADCELHRFCIFSRLRRVLPIRDPGKPSRLEMIDRALIRLCPATARFGGEVVLVLKK